jgi:hypothetical protein
VRVFGNSAGTTRFMHPKRVTPWNREATQLQRISTRSKTMSSVDSTAHAASSSTNHSFGAPKVVAFQ